MTLTLYLVPGSPPSRGTLLTVHALGLQDKIKIVPVNPLKSEHLKPEFIEKNPVHTIPTLEDGDFIVWDSHAINGYLVNKYGKNDDLYPKDPKKRAWVDCMNQFDTGYLFTVGINYLRSLATPENDSKLKSLRTQLNESLDMLETILERRTFTAGEQLTIADFSIVAIISTLVHVIPLENPKHMKIIAWLERMKGLPYYHVNQEGEDQFVEAFKAIINK